MAERVLQVLRAEAAWRSDQNPGEGRASARVTRSPGLPGGAPPEDHCLRLSVLPLGLPGWAD